MNDDENNDPIPQDFLDAWNNCAVPDCPNKSCLSLNSIFCYPHTVGEHLKVDHGVIK